MTPIEALQLALTKEQASIELYKRLATAHKEISELLYSLLNEEEKHRQLIEKKIVEMRRI